MTADQYYASGEGFSDEITGGLGSLRIPQIQSPNYVTGVSGWAIFQNGTVEFNSGTFRGTVTAGVFQGNDFIINSAGAFFYSGTPQFGNLVNSVTNFGGTDQFRNAYQGGVASYIPGTPTLCLVMNGVRLTSYTAPTAAGPFTFAAQLNTSVVGSTTTVSLGNGTGPFSEWITAAGGNSLQHISPAHYIGSNSGPATSIQLDAALVEVTNGVFTVAGNQSGGQIAVISNSQSNPSNSNFEIECAAAGDNAFGIMVNGDSFNRVKLTTAGILTGTGAASQDTRFLRSSAGTWLSDTIVANVSGSAETWHSLGTLAGATVNKGRYRMMPNGDTRIEVDITFAVSTAVPITFSNTMSAAYQVPGSVDIRHNLAQTNASGGLCRLFAGSAGGASPGQVQLAGFSNALGTYSGYHDYSTL